jgi:hypothetical protein
MAARVTTTRRPVFFVFFVFFDFDLSLCCPAGNFRSRSAALVY